MTRVSVVVFGIVLYAVPAIAQQSGAGLLSNDEIKKILAERVDTHRQTRSRILRVTCPDCRGCQT